MRTGVAAEGSKITKSRVFMEIQVFFINTTERIDSIINIDSLHLYQIVLMNVLPRVICIMHAAFCAFFFFFLYIRIFP